MDIARDAECPYCHAPISILDPEAVKHALAALGDQERRCGEVDAGAVLDALLAGKRAAASPAPEPVDLVRGAISMLLSTFPHP